MQKTATIIGAPLPERLVFGGRYLVFEPAPLRVPEDHRAKPFFKYQVPFTKYQQHPLLLEILNA